MNHTLAVYLNRYKKLRQSRQGNIKNKYPERAAYTALKIRFSIKLNPMPLLKPVNSFSYLLGKISISGFLDDFSANDAQ